MSICGTSPSWSGTNIGNTFATHSTNSAYFVSSAPRATSYTLTSASTL
jgi:hypothetical protein